MKQLLTIIAAVIALTVSAQERNDNTAIITTELSYADAFRTMGQMMTAKGFTIDNADRDFGTITTREVKVGGRFDPLFELKVTAIVGDGEITLTGQVRQENDSWRDLHMAGRVTMMYKAWQQFQELVENFPDGDVRYEQR